MKTQDRQKSCPNCEGKIPFEITQCPYCFATVPAESGIQSGPFKPSSFTSQFTPPYTSKSSEAPLEEKKFFTKMPPKEKVVPDESVKQKEEKKIFWPILLLTLAGNLFTLGVLQFFFSENGRLTLEINSSYWLLFVLVAAPLFYFGNQLLNSKEIDN